jgi:hypothetical protein
MEYTDIKQTRLTSSDIEANKLLSEGWTLQDITKNGSCYTFLLVML